MSDDGGEVTDYEAEAEAAAASLDNGASSADGAEAARGIPPERARYKGDAQTMAMALLPLATTRTFVQYDERAIVAKAKIDPPRIRKLHAVLHALKKVDGKLALTRNTWRRRSSCWWT